jgi:hypothetical protein
MTEWHILTAKLERAKEHIVNLESAWDRFLGDDGYPIESKDDPNTGNRTFYVGNVKPIPADIPLIAGDAIHNLRSALDHLAYELASICTGGSGPFSELYFPTGKDAASFSENLSRASEYKTKATGVVKRLRDDAIKAIRDIEPYGGGKGEIFWQLHKLDIIDKHHLLVTVASVNRFHSMSPAEITKIRTQFLGMLEYVPEKNDPFMFLKQTAIRRFPLEAGDELGTFPKAEVHDNMHFRIEIAFGKPEIVEGKTVIEMLHQAAHMIYGIFMTFSNEGLLK